MRISGRRWHRRIPVLHVHRFGATFWNSPCPPSGEKALRKTEQRATTMTRTSRLCIAILSALMIAGCAARGVHIAQLKDQPGKYQNRNVSITGVVSNSYGIPLVPFQVYNIDDGSGTLTVLSRSGGAPAKGARVRVKGRISEVGVFGGRSIGLHLEERDRKVYY